MSAVTLVDRLSSLRSALSWIFVLSTILLALCKLWLNYYEGRLLPIGPGDRDLTLAYRGRLDASGRSPDPTARRELFDAMAQVARTGRAPVDQPVGVQHADALP